MSNFEEAKKQLKHIGPYDASKGVMLWVIAVILLQIYKEMRDSGGQPAGPGL